MSLTHSLCLVIIVICHYVALESERTEIESEPEETKQLVSPSSDENTPAIFHWPRGVVPYYIEPENYDLIIANRIRAAMHTIETNSCVKFKDMGSKSPPGERLSYVWLLIHNPDGVRECSHGTLQGDGPKAILIVGYDCMQRRDILHALLHVLGFRDEVTHPQRDMYVRIMWPNIQPKYRSLFWMRPDDSPRNTMVEYDTMSIMHFHDRAYSVNGGPTIAPLLSGLLINPSDTLSQLDIMKLHLTFGHECNKRKVGKLLQTCQNVLKSDEDEVDDKSKGSTDMNSTEGAVKA